VDQLNCADQAFQVSRTFDGVEVIVRLQKLLLQVRAEFSGCFFEDPQGFLQAEEREDDEKDVRWQHLGFLRKLKFNTAQ
jgi:hypothetical protein